MDTTQMNPAALNTITSDAALTNALLQVVGNDKKLQTAILAGCLNADLKSLAKTSTRVGLYDQITILGNTNDKLGPDWPYRSPVFWSRTLENVFSSAVLNAPTLGEGLDFISCYGYLWNPALYFEKFDDPSGKTLVTDVIMPADLPPDLLPGLKTLRVLGLMATYLIMDETLKGRWTNARVLLAAPPSRKEMKNFFKADIVWNAPRFGLELPTRLLKRKSKNADPVKFRKATLFIQKMVSPPDVDRSLEEIVLAYINATQFHRPTIGEVGRSLGMSTRTLNRRLEQANVSFRQILEQSLQDRTRILLSQGQLSRGEIAERLGYKDQASFSRALRRWQVERS